MKRPQLPLGDARHWPPFAAAAVVLAVQLLIPPVVGLANNGDFGKVLAPFSVGAPVADEYAYSPLRYTFDAAHQIWTGYYSSAQILAAFAVDLNLLVGARSGTFDLRWIGIVHAVLLLIAFYSLPRRPWLAVFVFGDVLYVSQLNSFYMGTASLVFLMLTVAAYVRGWGFVFVAASLLFVTSKAQHSILGLLLVALLLVDRARLELRGRALAASVAALLFAVWFGAVSAPVGYSIETRFSAIFYRILPKSTTPADDLRAFGLDESWSKYSGLFAYSEGSPLNDAARRQEFAARTSYTAIVRYYLAHPQFAARDIAGGLGDAGKQRPDLGNFDRKYGFPPKTQSRSFALWSGWKRAAFEGRGAWNLAYFLGLGIAALWLGRSHPLRHGIAALWLGGWLAMAVAALADSLDMPRHFFLYHAIEDLLLIVVSVLIVGKVRVGRRPLAGQA